MDSSERPALQTSEIVFWVSSTEGFAPEQWCEWIRGHWQIENASHYVRDGAFAEGASRIRKSPDVVARLRPFAYNLILASGEHNIQNAPYRAAFDLAIKIAAPQKATNSPALGVPYGTQILDSIH